MHIRRTPLVLALLVAAIGVVFLLVGEAGRSGPVVCPGENSPEWAEGEEVPGPMKPGDTSCGVIVAGEGNSEIRTYEQQKAVQERDARIKRVSGTILIVLGGAGTVGVGIDAWRSRP